MKPGIEDHVRFVAFSPGLCLYARSWSEPFRKQFPGMTEFRGFGFRAAGVRPRSQHVAMVPGDHSVWDMGQGFLQFALNL